MELDQRLAPSAGTDLSIGDDGVALERAAIGHPAGQLTLFESRPEDEDLGRLVESTVWVNEAHPAYRRAVASRSDGYHVALTAALALAGLAAEPQRERAFVTSFLARWGEAIDRPPSSRGRRPVKRRSRQRDLPLDSPPAT